MPKRCEMSARLHRLAIEPMSVPELHQRLGDDVPAPRVNKAVHNLCKQGRLVNLRTLVEQGPLGNKPGVYIQAALASVRLAKSIDWSGVRQRSGFGARREASFNFSALEQAWRGAR